MDNGSPVGVWIALTMMFPLREISAADAQLNETLTKCDDSGELGEEVLASMNPSIAPLTTNPLMVKLLLSSVKIETEPAGSGQGLLPTKCSSNTELGETSSDGRTTGGVTVAVYWAAAVDWLNFVRKSVVSVVARTLTM